MPTATLITEMEDMPDAAIYMVDPPLEGHHYVCTSTITEDPLHRPMVETAIFPARYDWVTQSWIVNYHDIAVHRNVENHHHALGRHGYATVIPAAVATNEILDLRAEVERLTAEVEVQRTAHNMWFKRAYELEEALEVDAQQIERLQRLFALWKSAAEAYEMGFFVDGDALIDKARGGSDFIEEASRD